MSSILFRTFFDEYLIYPLQVLWWLQLALFMLMLSVISAVFLYYQALKAKKELLVAKDMLRVQLEIQDLTFSAISKEVHDNVGQILSLVKMQLNLLSENNETQNYLLEEAKSNISLAMDDLREIANGLSNRKLVSLGLISSLEHEAARLNETGKCQITILVEGNPLPVSDTQHLVIFRAVQYFLNRLTQEEGGNKIMLKICFFDNNWQVIIYRAGAYKNWKGQTRKEFLDEHALVLRRLSIIGGTFTISTEGETQILINIPYV